MRGSHRLLILFVVVWALTGCSANKLDTEASPIGASRVQPAQIKNDAELESTDKQLTLGFAQVGTESKWRLANSESVKQAALEEGIRILFQDAQQSQEAQIAAIRHFIDAKVDVIAFSPVVENGWDPILKESKKAGIPVILMDREINTLDTSLYETLVGADFVEEGRKAGKWLVDQYMERRGQINIAELQGTPGAAPTIDRHQGFVEIIGEIPEMTIVDSEIGYYTREQGKHVIQQLLDAAEWEARKIDVLFSHNDDMALGAIEAIEEVGLRPGVDILIISFDGTKEAFKAMIDGKINLIIECNPLLGPQVIQAAKDIAANKTVPKRIVTVDGVFTQTSAEREMPNRKY